MACSFKSAAVKKNGARANYEGCFYRHRRYAYGSSDAERSRVADGVSDFVPSPQTAVPSMTHARILVRLQRRVGYASGNKKGVYDVSRQRNGATNPIGLHSALEMIEVR
jgi:hypothetical protein